MKLIMMLTREIGKVQVRKDKRIVSRHHIRSNRMILYLTVTEVC